uniref:Uncharacterized protein n=1 Tax=Branchiostoma floridae TaxID=7739 RepID=C3ZAY0_BRAFL|eukprot:XP_002594006.1 hypothetical protein BRAFLDRAFT_68555 [Branchiostoma floridae]
MSSAPNLRPVACIVPGNAVSLKLTGITFSNISTPMGPVASLRNIRYLEIRGEKLKRLAATGLARFPMVKRLQIIVFIALQTRQNVNRDDHVMVELRRSSNQTGNVLENQAEGATNSTPNDPYYSTIRDEEDDDEPVRPYGMAKAGAQYGRAVKRSRSLGENSTTGPTPRSERNKCYNQTPQEDTAPKTASNQDSESS